MVNLTEAPFASIDALEAHAALWTRMQYMLDGTRLPQSLLWVGPRHAQVLAFAHRFMAIILCQSAVKPCGVCQSCRLLMQNIHPDVLEITEESPNSAIKVDQIRALQQDVYQRPQLGDYRFVLIHPASQLNRQSANALLKILEEPPSHTVFILIADDISGLPLTIMSRCQRTIFPPPERLNRIEQPDYLMIGAYYPEGSLKRALFEQRSAMLSTFCELLEGKTDVCSVATAWAAHAIDDLLWFFYLLTATLILSSRTQALLQEDELARVIQLFNQRGLYPVHFFAKLDTILEFIKINNQHIPLNKTLVLETILLGYVG